MRTKFADTLLINGRFLTMEDDIPLVQAIAVADGRILFTGSEADARQFVDTETKIIDLEGRVAVPGMIDTHTHIGTLALNLSRVNFRGECTKSLASVISAIQEATQTKPKGEWIVGSGYDESKFKEGPVILTKEILDEVAPDHPVFLTRICGHISVVNSYAMRLCGFTDDTADPKDGGHFFRDENGHLTGTLSGSAQGLVHVPVPTESETKRNFDTVQKTYFKTGVTSTADMLLRPYHFQVLQKMDQDDSLDLKVSFYMAAHQNSTHPAKLQQITDLGLLPGFGSPKLRFLGMKFALDGSTGGKTAAVSTPYKDDPENYGELYNKQEDLNEWLLQTAKAGLQACIHVIGDRAIESSLTALDYVNAQGIDTRPLRFRLEHLESPTPEQLQRIKDLDLLISLSSVFIYHLGDSHIRVLGQKRLEHAFPAKTLQEQNILFACNSDCPVCDVNPMYGIYAMVTRTTQEGQTFGSTQESIDRISALKAYTKNAAILLCNEDAVGTLKAGKQADIAVFEEDFLHVPDEALKDLTMYMTMVDGKIVYHA